MRLLLDECADARLAPILASSGHDVALVATLDPSADDRRVLAMALDDDRALITTDLDFGEMLVRERQASAGVVLLRIEGMPIADAASKLCDALDRHGSALRGNLLIISPRRQRLRRVWTLAP